MKYESVDKSYILADLRRGVIEFIFDKANGDRRKMRASLHTSYLPEGVTLDQNDPDNVAVWDIEKKDYRKIPLKRILSLQQVNTI